MGREIGFINALRGVHWLILLAVGTIGITGTFAIGQRIEDKALKSWVREAELDATAATIAVQSWLAQSETIISGLALGFDQPDQISVAEFEEIVFKAEEWNSEFSLDAVAIIKRVLRPQRLQMEEALGRKFSDATDAAKTVDDALDYMVVVNSSEAEGLLRPAVDLLTMAEMGSVAKTALRVPEKAVMGPAFTDSDGNIYTLVGISLPLKEREMIVVGRVNLSEMIDTLILDHASEGLMLRLSERENTAHEETLVHPVYGPLEAGDDVFHTVTIRVTRGEARWNYNWDVTHSYMGGAPTANVTMVQIGGLIITVLLVYSIGALGVQNTIIRNTVKDSTKTLRAEVAERRKAEKVQLEFKSRLLLHLEHMPMAAITWDANFECVEWNPAATRIFGFSREEVLGKHPFDLLVPENLHDQIGELFQSLLNQAGGSHSINENVTRDGRYIICEWFNTPLIGDDGESIGVSSYAQDITHSHKADRKLKESEETFRSFYEIIPDVLMITGSNTGLCVDVNEGFCRATGYRREEVVGKLTTDLGLWENAADRKRLVRELREKGVVLNLAANFRRKDGSLWPGMMSACIVKFDGRSQVISSTKDVSDIRRSETEAIKANMAKSEFLSSMSHELRTPMNAILGFAQILEASTREPLSPRQKSSVEQILKGGHHLMELIDQVLDLSKIESGKMKLSGELLNIGKIGPECLALVENWALDRGLSIESDLGSGHTINADRTRFKQVLLNLLSNAIKYNRAGGRITLSSEIVAGRKVRIIVSDTGLGISHEQQAQIFDPFNRLGKESGDIGGTGIGLTITKQLVEAMGGRVGFESEPGKGSVFWVEFPK
ncbi:MAG: PAS domain S-box protein [Gammaproteobacteria bacterium]|nr:PAS domain S-box protein [Gammaproteobacteria bacterium]